MRLAYIVAAVAVIAGYALGAAVAHYLRKLLS